MSEIPEDWKIFLNGLVQTLDARSEREQAIRTAYEARPEPARRAAVLTYRCKATGRRSRSCLLLIVWRTPAGLAFYRPRYKLQLDRNLEHSNESGRAVNTEDGVNHWKALAGMLDDLRRWPEVFLNLVCDHVNENISAPQLLAEADAATPGTPTRRYL